MTTRQMWKQEAILVST